MEHSPCHTLSSACLANSKLFEFSYSSKSTVVHKKKKRLNKTLKKCKKNPVPNRDGILRQLFMSIYILPNSPFTVEDIRPPSALPLSLPITAPITFPISEGPLAPSVEIVS